MSKQFLENIKQQTKRLINQLQEIEELKDQLSAEEYQQMKKDTIVELNTFQKSLSEMSSGELTLTSELDKSKAELFDAIRKSVNKDEILKSIVGIEATSVRQSIAQMEEAFNIGKLAEKDYVKAKVAKILQIKDLGIELSAAEKAFLDVKQQFGANKVEKMNSKVEKECLDIAQEQIKKDLS